MRKNGARTTEAAVRTLDLFSDRCKARDLEGTLALFTDHDDVLLIGSEAGEAVQGREALRDFFVRLFHREVTYSWEFEHSTASSAGDIAWVFAEGYEVVTAGGGEAKRIVFRMSGVLQQTGDRWLWRMLQGSEPAEHY